MLNYIQKKRDVSMPGLLAVLILLWTVAANATIPGVSGTSFNFVARQGHISLTDGGVMLMWGYAIDSGGPMQYPGPTLILNQGDTVTIFLRNFLPSGAGNVSIVFPGHRVTAAGGMPGLFTQEAPPDGMTVVSYTFTAAQPGTYLYHSGTRPDLQVEMGLVGAIIVRPNRPPQPDPPFPDLQFAYDDPNTGYHREYLYLLTELDLKIHQYVENGRWDLIDMTAYFASAWFVNGRNFPDVMTDNFVPWLPTQPYNCQPRMHPGETVLIRYISAGRDIHPIHFHENDVSVIAQDGRLLESNPGVSGVDLQWKSNTIKANPGQTTDFLWTWTGENLGWDIYGHLPTDPLEIAEYAPDHGKPFPVIIPPRDDMTFGQFYSGSPFLGAGGDLPPGHSGLNTGGGFFYMWHSHTEKEITTIGLFPGGSITFMIIEHPSVPIP